MIRSRKQNLDDLLAGNVERDAKEFAGFKPLSPGPEAGDEMRWIEVELLDDNPFQPRAYYQPQDQADMVESLNVDGQLQPAGARPHPTRQGRYQLIWGHRRKYAVLEGAPMPVEGTSGASTRYETVYANAGIRQPEPHKFIGKLLVIVKARPVPDLEMRRQAFTENHSRLDLNAMEKSRFYIEMQQALTVSMRESGELGPDKKASYRALSEFLGERNHQSLARYIALAEPGALHKEIVEALENGDLNERHGRALLRLREDPRRQLSMFHQIHENRMSGSEAERLVERWIEKQPTPSYQLMLDNLQKAQRTERKRKQDQARELNQRQLEAGTSHLSAVPAQRVPEGGKQEAETRSQPLLPAIPGHSR